MGAIHLQGISRKTALIGTMACWNSKNQQITGSEWYFDALFDPNQREGWAAVRMSDGRPTLYHAKTKQGNCDLGHSTTLFFVLSIVCEPTALKAR